MKLASYVLAEKQEAIKHRRYLHAHPEPSLKEYATATYIEKVLKEMGIDSFRVGETGVCAIIKGANAGKVLAIRADSDALLIQDLKDCDYKSTIDGVMHACGHDAHCASLLLSAKLLNARSQTFNGEIRLFFQQSEENGQGARQFVKAKLMDGVDRVIGYHGNSDLDIGKVSLTPGPNNAACDFFKIVVRGKSAHVSQPDKAIDALYIASQIVVSLQSIVARNTSALDSVVVGIGVLRAGTTYNIIADEAIIEGTTRTFTPQTRAKTNKMVENIAKQIALTYNASASVEILNFANPLINHESVAKELFTFASNIVGESNVITNQEKRLGADDFADFLQLCEGCYMFVGTRNQSKPNTDIAHHHGLFDIDEDSMLIASNIFVDYALWYLNT